MNLAGDIYDLNLTSLSSCFSKIIGHCRISHPDWILILRTNKTHFLFSDLGSYFCIRKTPARNGAGLTRLVWQSRTEARVRDENMDHKSLPNNGTAMILKFSSHNWNRNRTKNSHLTRNSWSYSTFSYKSEIGINSCVHM